MRACKGQNERMNALHVVLGAGQIGPLVARRLAAAGHQVRVVRRTASKSPGQRDARIETVAGDIRDAAFADRATTGEGGQRAAVVYDCMNPTYDKWDLDLLPIGQASLAAAARAGAKLVALDCLYMYGMPERDSAGNALPMREDSPMNPCSHKGELRKKLAELRLGAHQRGEVRVAIGRASDFFGPDLAQSFWGERFFKNIAKGSAGECLGDPDMRHAYTYSEDVARGLVTLGERAESSGSAWHLPTVPAESTQALATRVGRAFGVPNAKVKHVPRLLLRGLGLFDPIMRELEQGKPTLEAGKVLRTLDTLGFELVVTPYHPPPPWMLRAVAEAQAKRAKVAEGRRVRRGSRREKARQLRLSRNQDGARADVE